MGAESGRQTWDHIWRLVTVGDEAFGFSRASKKEENNEGASASQVEP